MVGGVFDDFDFLVKEFLKFLKFSRFVLLKWLVFLKRVVGGFKVFFFEVFLEGFKFKFKFKVDVIYVFVKKGK